MIWVMITVVPEKSEAEPRPAMARPMMKAIDEGAAPHRAEPTSKMRIDSMAISLVL